MMVDQKEKIDLEGGDAIQISRFSKFPGCDHTFENMGNS